MQLRRVKSKCSLTNIKRKGIRKDSRHMHTKKAGVEHYYHPKYNLNHDPINRIKASLC